MKIPSILAALSLCAAAPAALADTLRVPSEAYPTIQSAVDAAAPGDTIVVADGTYEESATVSGKTGLELRGAGWPEMHGPLTVTGGSSGILVRGFEFVGAGLGVNASTDVTLTRLRVRNATGAISSHGMDGLLISRCAFTDIEGSACTDRNSLGVVIEKCRFDDIGGYAVLLTPDEGAGTDGVVLSKNRVVNAAGGFGLSGDDAVVEKNRMEGLASFGVDGIGFSSTDGAVLSKNRIETSGAVAIRSGAPDWTLEKNTVVGGGIELEGAGQHLDGNRVLGAQGDGIVLSGTAVLSRNQVRGAGGTGILVQADGSTLDRNSVADTGSHGIVIHADGCDLDRNSAARAGGSGFGIDGTGNTLTRNRARGSGEYDLADTYAEGANTYEGNRFGTTQFNYVP